ncbi:Activator of Hsp90 ATPase homolog 1-like protein [Bhargavaea ginsengi]|uniref:Activator of Hsp90 ATPase homolog 1-like protein n=1 Tax=Bhargavaea ginsengi TaxID=426757 RepID=A0A1H6XT74_9BACL|nr:SRPBCC domain-containing protein [Bhargavaea ginsengi]SEJ28092.1 Activator of Hsp90 ATPase homolog 1-like protein [Bhargavaea ginsengi]
MAGIAELKRNGEGLTAYREVRYPYERTEVWAYLTDNDRLSGWFDELRMGEAAEGGHYLFDMGEHGKEKLEIFRFESGETIEFDWFGDVVRFDLISDGGSTVLAFKETIRKLTEQTVKDLAGWHVCLDVIGCLLDGEKPEDRHADWEAWHDAYARAVGEL